MGTDFIEKATKSFKKSWDRARTELATADFFTRTPSCAPRTIAADIVGDAQLQLGDRLTVEMQDGGLIARRGNTDVARVSNPSADILGAVEVSCGVAKGTVTQVHDLARIAEIALC